MFGCSSGASKRINAPLFPICIKQNKVKCSDKVSVFHKIYQPLWRWSHRNSKARIEANLRQFGLYLISTRRCSAIRYSDTKHTKTNNYCVYGINLHQNVRAQVYFPIDCITMINIMNFDKFAPLLICRSISLLEILKRTTVQGKYFLPKTNNQKHVLYSYFLHLFGTGPATVLK